MVAANSKRLLFNVPSTDLANKPGAYGSYADGIASMDAVCTRIWMQEDLENPGFTKKMLGATSAMSLAISSYFGHGILASMVFGNGDVATFQVNPMDPNACEYVKGSAKDRYGASLPDTTPSVGGGSSGSVAVGASSGGGAKYSVGGSDWLFCSYSGGTLLGCYVEYVPE